MKFFSGIQMGVYKGSLKDVKELPFFNEIIIEVCFKKWS